MKGKTKEYTFAEFAKKIGVARDTIYRWHNLKRLRGRFKMYDAEVVEVAGKKFVKVSS
jgi:IS30 family transposase